LPHFVRGLWDAAGELKINEAHCSASPRIIDGLCHAIATSTGYRPTEVSEANGRKVAIWRDVVAVLALRRWMASPG
jgi:hypothetical protein